MITDHGVNPIPSFDPGIISSLKSVNALVRASAQTNVKSTQAKLRRVLLALSNLTVEQVEQVVGPLDDERAIIFQDQDGGFTCGSTGKPPIPVPWPPLSWPSAQELITQGVVAPDLVNLLRTAREQKKPLVEVFEHPAEAATQLHVKLSEKSAQDLQALAPSKLQSIKDDTDREVISFFHSVVADGRFLDIWYRQPYEVAKSIGVELTEKVIERLVMGEAAHNLIDPGRRACLVGAVLVGDVVIIAVTVGLKSTPPEKVHDRSGILKH